MATMQRQRVMMSFLRSSSRRSKMATICSVYFCRLCRGGRTAWQKQRLDSVKSTRNAPTFSKIRFLYRNAKRYRCPKCACSPYPVLKSPSDVEWSWIFRRRSPLKSQTPLPFPHGCWHQTHRDQSHNPLSSVKLLWQALCPVTSFAAIIYSFLNTVDI